MLQLDAVTAERNSLHEDLVSHRDSKRTVDKQWRLERERCERLESELAFYQNHSAQALSDRDKVAMHFTLSTNVNRCPQTAAPCITAWHHSSCVKVLGEQSLAPAHSPASSSVMHDSARYSCYKEALR